MKDKCIFDVNRTCQAGRHIAVSNDSSYQSIIKDIGDFPLDQTIVELIKENLDLDEVHIAYKPWDNGHWIRFIKGNKKIDGWISDHLLLEQEFDIINHELKRMEATLNV